MSEIIRFKTIDSTNEEAKRIAKDGLIIISDSQSLGKGRLGRSFLSIEGKGIYMTFVKQVNTSLESVSEITAMAAVSVRDAILGSCDISPDIKWPNDLQYRGKKLCGILTELYFRDNTPFIILGIGVNVSHDLPDFGEELCNTAVSLKQICKKYPDIHTITDSIIVNIEKLFSQFPYNKEYYLSQYRKFCITVGKHVTVRHGSLTRSGTAEGISDNFSLSVRWDDGTVSEVNSGEVSLH